MDFFIIIFISLYVHAWNGTAHASVFSEHFCMGTSNNDIKKGDFGALFKFFLSHSRKIIKITKMAVSNSPFYMFANFRAMAVWGLVPVVAPYLCC